METVVSVSIDLWVGTDPRGGRHRGLDQSRPPIALVFLKPASEGQARDPLTDRPPWVGAKGTDGPTVSKRKQADKRRLWAEDCF